MTLPLTDVVFGQKRVAGTIVGGRADMMEMLDLAAARGIKPMLEIMKMSQVRGPAAEVPCVVETD